MKRVLALVGALVALATAYPHTLRGALGHALDAPHRRISTAAGSVFLESTAWRSSADPGVVARLRQAEGTTYIGEILSNRDSAIARWRERRTRPVSVWVQPASSVQDWRPELVEEAHAAFESWNDVQLPIRFVFVTDSAAAEVHVNWVDRFNVPISGRTKWARDEGWWITDGDITIAVHHHRGEVLDGDAIRALALHEIGHLIGLDHTTDLGSIMAPKVRIRALAEVDRATARLVYTLPAGVIR